ncbi:putative ribosome-binding protein 1-like isoform X11 [Penaeus vannamei]|uniref:Putative ribosome-binding protein 1-like isoform X11 n=1 Tax=Penaeus vannamei TaxID=6689 RepID=A0A423UA04_PENVA|nr:putative ribosome-binding protein 1-like isoform X11 [Penaeus vannamei]
MDVLVLGAVVVVLTVVVYLLATLGTKETPYEEALAEQRQKQEQEQIALAKSDRQQKYKNTKQKKPKARKDDFEQNGPASATKVEEIATEPDTTPPSTEPEASPQPQQIVVEEVTETIVTKAEAVKVEATKGGKSSKPEAAKSSQTKAESPKADSVKVESTKGKTSKVEASKSDQAKAESPKVESGKSKAAKAEAAKTETAKTEAAKAEPAKGKAAKTDVGKAEAAKITKAKETKTEAAKTEAAKTKAAPESTPPPQGKENKKEKVVTPVTRPKVEDNFEVVDGSLNSTGKATPTQEKKKKKEKQKTDMPAPKESRILPLVQDAHLSSGEIQTLIDILLNKQQQNNAGGEWVEKGRVDPTTQLRRQLEEVETRLREKDEAHSALSAKITALRTELNCERSRAVKLKAQLDDTVANHSRELETANANAQTSQNARLNEMKAALEKEYQAKMQQQQKILQQLQSTNNESEIATLRASLSESEMQTAVLRQEHEELTRRCQQYEEHIAALDEKRAGENASRNTQITELQAQLASADAQRAQALAEASAASAERDALTVQLANETSKTAQTQHKLQEAVQEKTKVESRLAQIEGELCSVRQVVLDQTAEIERLKEEKESLASQSVRPAAEGQENGDVHAEQTQGPSTAHLESLVKEREIQIEQQISEVSNLKKEIARLKEELDNQKAKNNEASGEVEEEKTKVRAVLRRIFPEVVVDDALIDRMEPELSDWL